jgi:hypothetical protein
MNVINHSPQHVRYWITIFMNTLENTTDPSGLQLRQNGVDESAVVKAREAEHALIDAHCLINYGMEGLPDEALNTKTEIVNALLDPAIITKGPILKIGGGIVAPQLPPTNSKIPQFTETRKCHVCQKHGHLARSCPAKMKGGRSSYTRGGKNRGLVASSLQATVQQLQGEKDALNEIVQMEREIQKEQTEPEPKPKEKSKGQIFRESDAALVVERLKNFSFQFNTEISPNLVNIFSKIPLLVAGLISAVKYVNYVKSICGSDSIFTFLSGLGGIFKLFSGDINLIDVCNSFSQKGGFLVVLKRVILFYVLYSKLPQCITSVNKLKPIVNKYSFIETRETEQDSDVRIDDHIHNDILHEDPLISKVLYEKKFGPIILYKQQMTVSKELLAQLSSITQHSTQLSEEQVVEKISQKARSCPTINLDRYDFTANEGNLASRIVDNTVRVSYALYKSKEQSLVNIPFQNPRLDEDTFATVIGMVKSTCLLLSQLRAVLLYVGRLPMLIRERFLSVVMDVQTRIALYALSRWGRI